MEEVVDADMTSALWFLTGVSSGSACLIVAGAWTFSEHRSYTATVSMLAFIIGYLLVGAAPFCPNFLLFPLTIPAFSLKQCNHPNIVLSILFITLLANNVIHL